MDCSICHLRSSASFCVECQALLCDECGDTCDDCAKRICAPHTHFSRSGRPLCFACFEVYNERGHAGDREGGGLVPAEGGATDEHRDRLRSLRGQSDIRPWKVSLGFAVAAVAVTVLLLAIPALRVTVLGYTGAYTAAFVVLVCPFLALAWAFVGVLERNPRESRKFNALGAVLALVAVGLAFPVLRDAPTPEESMEARLELNEPLQKNRDDMTPEEREAWRQGLLQLYRLRP